MATRTLLIISLSLSTLLIDQSAASSSSPQQNAQSTEYSSQLLDLLIRDYTFKSFKNQHSIKTGVLRPIHLPSNFSGITVDIVRFRCGSLKRYGAQVKEFHVGVGAVLQPCGERLMLLRQNLGLGTHWSDLYYTNFDLSGYRLVSPVLGLLAYNAIINNVNAADLTSSYQIYLAAGDTPITVDFGNVTKLDRTILVKPMCASFGFDGKVTLADEVSPAVCAVRTAGHFGMVVRDQSRAPAERRRPAGDGRGGEDQEGNKKIGGGGWRKVAGGVVGSVVAGVFLLALVFAAVVVAAKKKRKRAKMEEMERRAYEEEALQVAMVGHSRVFTASATRTLPSSILMEHHCVPN